MLAIRLFNDVTATLDKAKRWLMSDWFDVTPEFAQQAIRLASEKLTVPTFSHGDMLQKVRTIRKSMIDGGSGGRVMKASYYWVHHVGPRRGDAVSPVKQMTNGHEGIGV